MSFSYLEIGFATKVAVVKEAQSIICSLIYLEISERKKANTIDLHAQCESLLEPHRQMFIDFEGIYAPLKEVFGPKFATFSIKFEDLTKSRGDHKYIGRGIFEKAKDVKSLIVNTFQVHWTSLLNGPNKEYPSGWTVEDMIKAIIQHLIYLFNNKIDLALKADLYGFPVWIFTEENQL
jgi:hypothetical protein